MDSADKPRSDDNYFDTSCRGYPRHPCIGRHNLPYASTFFPFSTSSKNALAVRKASTPAGTPA